MKINANTKEFDCMVIFAVRYVLSRSCVTPMIVLDFINNNKENISDSAISTIIDSIYLHEDTDNLETEYNKALWAEFRNELINYRKYDNDK